MAGPKCSVCGTHHGNLAERFCSWCLSEDPKELRNHHSGRVYAIWRRDRDGRRICRECYEILLTREKAAGIVHVGRKKHLYETIHQMKEVLFVKPEHTIANQIEHLMHPSEKGPGEEYKPRAARKSYDTVDEPSAIAQG